MIKRIKFLFLSLRLRKELNKRNISLSVGVPRGDILGPPLSNATLEQIK